MIVLCLGFRKGFVSAAKSRGLEIHFIVEKVKDGLEGLHFTKVADLANVEEVVAAALKTFRNEVVAVVTGHEHALASAAALRSIYSTAGVKELASTLKFRDKKVQKEAVGLAINKARCDYMPRGSVVYAELAQKFGDRFILKPSNGQGAKATTLISNQTELDSYLKNNPTVSDVQTVIESFVPGSEIHVDGIWYEDQILWATASCYLGNLLNWVDNGVVGDFPLEDSTLTAAALKLTAKVLTNLKAPNTVFHLEAFVTPVGELVFGEVAARLPGGMCPETIALTYDLDLYGAAIDIELGKRPDISRTIDEPTVVHGFVFLRRNSEFPVSREEILQRFDCVECYYPSLEEGRRGSYGRWGHAIMQAHSQEALRDKLLAIASFTNGESDNV